MNEIRSYERMKSHLRVMKSQSDEIRLRRIWYGEIGFFVKNNVNPLTFPSVRDKIRLN